MGQLLSMAIDDDSNGQKSARRESKSQRWVQTSKAPKLEPGLRSSDFAISSSVERM